MISKRLPIAFILPFLGFAQPSQNKSWRLAPHAIEVQEGRFDIVIADSPEHWSVGVVAGTTDRQQGAISAGSATMDGPFFSGINDLNTEHIVLKPGAVEIRGVKD
jgi:hypothetical protein